MQATQPTTANTAAPAKPCASCGEPATIKCPNCIDGVDSNKNNSRAMYCNDGCRRSHLGKHRAVCLASNEREVLYRLGDFACGLFLFLCRAMWTTAISDAKLSDDGIIHLYEGQARDDTAIQEFPAALRGENFDNLQRLAVLTRGGGRKAVALLAPLVHFAGLRGALTTPSSPWFRQC